MEQIRPRDTVLPMYPLGARKIAGGRIGPVRSTPTGTTLRLVAVVGTAALRITTVQPPVGGNAA